MTDRIEGATYVCTVPAELGTVTKLEVKGGRVIARTESGHTMIVPHPRNTAEQLKEGGK